MVRDVFRLAKENAPAIIFIDEVDAIATARFDAQTGADRSAPAICRLMQVGRGAFQTPQMHIRSGLRSEASMLSHIRATLLRHSPHVQHTPAEASTA